jgi:ketosteroid isomerase-like protein
MPAFKAAETLQALFEAINTRDLNGLAALHADEYELVDEASGETFRGPNGARQNDEAWLAAFPDLEWEITNVIDDGDREAVEATGRDTHTGPLPNGCATLRPTQRRIEIRICTVGHVRHGKLVHGRDYYDRSLLLRQLAN